MIQVAFDLLSDIKALLIGITTDIYGDLPSDLDIAIAIAHTGGLDPEHTFSGGNATLQKPKIIKPSFQVVIRHPSEHLLHEMEDLIKTALDGKTNYTPSGTSRTYLVILQNGDILDGGRDSSRRHIHYLNFHTEIINAY